jgi:Tol biopolymer transport system component/DNA-binding winged helix-turn-helix (wHTH) protein
MSVQLEPPQRSARKLQFGLFEADLATGELRKSGIRIRIQAQPFRVLSFLLERPGEVVTREEIQQRLWGSDTIVDFDHSLGTAINKVREALNDSADNPRFIETLARRGYRFLAPVNPVLEEGTAEGAIVVSTPSPETAAGATALSAVRGPWPMARTGLALFLVLAVGSGIYLAGRWARPTPRTPPQIRQITFSGRVSPGDPLFESLPATATDGTRIYFPEIEHGRALLAQALVADGEANTLELPSEIAAPMLDDLSPDGSKLLLRNHLATNAEQALWIVSTIGGAAQRIPGILAHDATWMPDGQRVLYASGNDLYVARENGSDIHKFATLPGRAFWLRWSPDGSRLRFTLLNAETHSSHLWQIAADGANARPLFPSGFGDECCGSWTPDGRDYVFQRTIMGASNIWVKPEGAGWLQRAADAYPLTDGPLDYQAPITAPSGRRIFFIGLNRRSELLRFDSHSQIFVPYGSPLSEARRVGFSRDGQWVAWIRQYDGSLWRSRPDGSERLQLTARPTEVFMMHWSPDDKQLVVMAREPEKRWALYTIDAEGGRLHPLYAEDRSQADPDWSPDGKRVVFGRLPDLMAEAAQPKAIYILDLATRQIEKLPGSEGLFSPRWSASGRYIAALSIDQTRLMLYDLSTRTWRTLAQQSAADPTWAHDDQSIYFHDFAQAGQPLYKVEIATGRIERVADLNDLRAADVVDYRFAGLAPGDIPLVSARASTANLYTTTLTGR